MRELRFRCWQENHPLGEPMMGYSDKEGCLAEFFSIVEKYKLHDKVMQYTGRKDKNGKEGYHKDFCKHKSGLYSIEWIETDAKFVLIRVSEGILKNNTLDIRYLETMEVIGNVYETPKLLEKIND